MSDFTSLENHFLIAMPSLQDPYFERTVTLICQHNSDGALGIVINRVTNLTLGDILQQLELPDDQLEAPETPVYFGGPVQSERGLILHEADSHWESTLKIGDEFGLTTSKDIIEAIAHNTGPKCCLMALGYAGWGDGQLERELQENAWLSGPADREVIFKTPIDERWSRAAEILGIDINQMVSGAGHA